MKQRRSKGLRPRGDGTRGPRSSSATSAIRIAAATSFVSNARQVTIASAWTAFERVAGVGFVFPSAAVFLVATIIAAVCHMASAFFAFVYALSRRPPLRKHFVIFLLSGVNLEANISIAKEKEKAAVQRAERIAALNKEAYAELLARNEAALKELPIVNTVQLVQVASKLNNSYVRVNLNCTERCGLEVQPKLRCSAKCPTVAQGAEVMLEHLLEHHQACLQPRSESPAAGGESCAGCCEGSCSSSTTGNRNAFARMFESQRQKAEMRAAELRFQSAEHNLEQLRKRARTGWECSSTSSSTRGAAGAREGRSSNIPYYDRYKDWDHAQFMTRMGESMRRRSVIPSHEVQRPEPRNDACDQKDALLHWRRGLVGAVQDWADGSLDNVLTLIVRLINHFNSSSHPTFKQRVIAKLAGMLDGDGVICISLEIP
ncbi:hypothetical protein AB1Y20_002647 [Prymnesium parvum]|uniref:Uncharacterized protein n=1 Tax=Prymnesium parvum TaxID=97485 RepID=A0AB34J9W6_PRYPA